MKSSSIYNRYDLYYIPENANDAFTPIFNQIYPDLTVEAREWRGNDLDIHTFDFERQVWRHFSYSSTQGA